jgi:hypothetical protein
MCHSTSLPTTLKPADLRQLAANAARALSATKTLSLLKIGRSAVRPVPGHQQSPRVACRLRRPLRFSGDLAGWRSLSVPDRR